MKVSDRSNLANVGPAESGKSQETQRTGRDGGLRGARAGSQGSGDLVELSKTAGKLSLVMQSSANDRASRISSLAADYASGRYVPDALATSRAMVSEALAGGSL